MYSSSDLERFFLRYKAEAEPQGISIQKFCIDNNVPYNLFKVKQQAISPQSEMKIRFGAISARKSAIYVSNPGWEVSQTTGKRSRESQFAQEIIASSGLLQELRYISQSFRKIINGDNEDALDTWITETKEFNIKNINSFVNGVIRDRDAICNAIRYPWTNGLVEGNVNRLLILRIAVPEK